MRATVRSCFLLLLAAGGASRVFAYELRETPDGIALRWPSSPVPIPYYIDSRAETGTGDGGCIGAIQSAFQTWENVATGDVRFLCKGLVESGGIASGANMVIWAQDDWPYDSRYVAKTRLYYRRGEGTIVRAEIVLNARDYRWSTNSEGGTLDVQNSVTHEVGHFLGLDDVHSGGQTMFEYIGLGEREKGSLSDDEREGLGFAYPRISPEERILLSSFSLDYGAAALRPAGEDTPLGGESAFAAICAIPSAGAGIVRAGGGGMHLLLPEGEASAPSGIPIASGGLHPGRIRAVAALPPEAPGATPRLAALFSGEGGLSFAVGSVPPAPGAFLSMAAQPVSGADDVVAFAALGPGEEGLGDAVAVLEKARGIDFFLSVSLLLPDPLLPGGILLSRLRCWRVPDCADACGLTVAEEGPGRKAIVLLLRSEAGGLELASYGGPFSHFPSDGATLAPSCRVDASSVDAAGDALGLAGGPPAAGGRLVLRVLLAR